MDMSFMSKFLVQGRDAGALLDHLSADDVDGDPGGITYTQWLNERRHASRPTSPSPSSTTTASGSSPPTPRTATCADLRRGAAHLGDAHAVVTDVTVGLRAAQRPGAALARAAAPLTDADLSNEAFPFRTRPRDRRRLRPGAVRPDHLRRRARLRAVRPRRAGRSTCTTADRGRRDGRPAPRRPQGARQPADGEGLPRLRPRHRQHRLRRSRPASASPWPRQARRLRRHATRCSRRKAAGPPTRRLVQVRLTRPRAAAVPRRGGAPRRRGRRLRPRRVVRLDARRRRRPGAWSRRTSRSRRPGSTPAPGRSTSPDAASRPSSRSSRSTTRR